MIFNRIIGKVRSFYCKDKPAYPMRVELPLANTKVKFDVFSDVEYFRIAEYGDEKTFLQLFLNALHDEDIVFDIGASVGLMTVHAASVVTRGQVLAFEPDIETFKRLQNNVELNNLENVSCFMLALSDVVGDATLFTDGAAGRAPTLRQQPNRADSPRGQLQIITQTLDNGISAGKWPLPTILKIDIEGAELLFLKGAHKLLAGSYGPKPRLVFLEVHPKFLGFFGQNLEDIQSFLAGVGYSILSEQRRDDQIHWVLSASV